MEAMEIREILKPVRCFLLDMDGTFYLGNQLLDGSLAFLEKVQSSGRQAMFLTNNSSKSAEVYIEKLRRMGVRDPFLRVLTSGQATAQFVMKTFVNQSAFVLGTEMLRREMQQNGVVINDQTPDYVIIGYDTTLNYAKMTKVCDLVRSGLPYIATHPDFNCPDRSRFRARYRRNHRVHRGQHRPQTRRHYRQTPPRNCGGSHAGNRP